MTRRWLALACWIGFVAASLAGLHRLGDWFPLDLILAPASPFEPALAATMRLTGLAVGYWLAASTILYLIGRVSRLAGAIRAVRWATFGPVRRLIDGTVAGAMVATIGVPAGAITGPGYVPVPAGDPPPPAVTTPPARDESVSPATVMPGEPFLSGRQGPVPGLDGDEPESFPSAASTGPTEVAVRPGDDMWRLAEQRLSAIRGREVSDIEIAPYWLKVVATNLASIKSGDPDLIFPGEILVLPAVDP